MREGSGMGKYTAMAVCAGAALAAPAALYIGAEYAEATNNRDVAKCASVLGVEATTAATVPAACRANEDTEYNGFTYHISKTQSGDAIISTAYYDIPSRDAYVQKAVTAEGQNLLLPFSTLEFASYAIVSAVSAIGAYGILKSRRADKASVVPEGTSSNRRHLRSVPDLEDQLS